MILRQKFGIAESFAHGFAQDLDPILRHSGGQEKVLSGLPEGAKHRQDLSLHVRLGKRLQIRDMGELRMAFAYGNLDARMDVDQLLFDPDPVAPKQRVADVHASVGFTPLDGDVDLRTGESDHESGVLQTEYESEEPPRDVNRMADGLGADAHARGRAQFLQTVQSGMAMRDEQVVLDAVRRAEIGELVDVVLHPRGAEHRVGHQRRTHAAHGQAVGFGHAVNMIGRLPAAASAHVLHDDHRIPGDMFAPDIDHAARPQIRRSRRRTA